MTSWQSLEPWLVSLEDDAAAQSDGLCVELLAETTKCDAN